MLKYLLYKEFVQTFRNKVLMRIIIYMPIFQLLILPWALTFEQRNISLSVVDNDKSTTSRRIIGTITATQYFNLTDYSPTYDQAIEAVDKKDADLVLEIPANFEKEMIRGDNPKLMLAIDAVNGQKGSIILSYMTQIVNSFNKDFLEQNFSNVKGIEIKPYYKYNVNMRYQDFMVPGILVILMSLIGGMLAALNIVREKEMGTIEQINVTPIPKHIFILAKIIPFWIIGMIILTIGVIISWVIYGLAPWDNLFNIYLFAFCYMVAFSGFGIIISNYSDTIQQAVFAIFFFIMMFILLSGLFTPISSMPEWARILTIFNPLTYFVKVIRLLYLKDSGFYDILPDLGIIIVFAIVLNTWAIISYKKIN